MIADRIKMLREREKMSQADLAEQLSLSRSSVSSWEMSLSVPSIPYLTQLSKLFKTSTDYLLGLEETATINVAGLSDDEVVLLVELANKFRAYKKNAL